MKWRALFIITGVVFAGLFSGCSRGDQKTMTPVTVTVGGGKASQKALYRSAGMSKSMPIVVSITFTIEGPGMDTVTRVVPVTPPQTITEVFYVLNGPSRNFTIEAKDGTGTVIYSGYVLANLDGEPITLTLPLQTMIFNRLIWSPWGDEATAIARDVNTGDLIIVGHTYGDLEGNLNSNTSHTTTDVFVTRVTSTGARIWTKQFGTTDFDICYSVATSSAGDIYLAGSTLGNLNGNILSGVGSIDAFVSRLTATGSLLWTRTTGTAGAFTFGQGISVDSAGNLYLTGKTDGGLDGNANADPTNSTFDAFVMKYDGNGIKQWTDQFGTSGDDSGASIAVYEAAGTSLYVVGSTGGDLDGTGPGNYGGMSDMFAVKLDAVSGANLWTRQSGTTDIDDAYAVAVDPFGNAYVVGRTYGDLDGILNSNQTTTGTTSDLFVMKYDVNGGKQWTVLRGTPGNDVATGIIFDSNGGDVIVTGRTNGDMDGFGNAGFDDMFMVRYNPFGGFIIIQQLGTKANDAGMGVVSDNNGNITVLGNTYGGFTSSATEDMFLQQYQYPLP